MNEEPERTKKNLPLKKIISGGQEGADQGGLLAAQDLGLATGGTAPHGWITAYGSDPSLGTRFGLVEGPSDPKKYPIRTRMNVRNSDATVIFGDPSSPGCQLTLSYCRMEGRPFLINPSTRALRDWVEEKGVETLNVAGNRERNNVGIRDRVRNHIVLALRGRIERSAAFPANDEPAPIIVVNKRAFNDNDPRIAAYPIARPTPLGNPFSHLNNTNAMFHVESREKAVKLYDEQLRWVLDQPADDLDREEERLRDGFLALEGFHKSLAGTGKTLALVCCCAPAVCHGDVLKAVLEERMK